MSPFVNQLFAASVDATPKYLALPIPPKGIEVVEVESVFIDNFKFGERVVNIDTTRV